MVSFFFLWMPKTIFPGQAIRAFQMTVVCWIITRYGYYMHTAHCVVYVRLSTVWHYSCSCRLATRHKIAWLLSHMILGRAHDWGLWVTLHFSLMFQVWPRYFSLLDRNRFYFSFIYLIFVHIFFISMTSRFTLSTFGQDCCGYAVVMFFFSFMLNLIIFFFFI